MIALELLLGLGLNNHFALASQKSEAQLEATGFCGLTPEISDQLYPTIADVWPNSAAEEAGLMPGMELVSIDGKNAAFMGIDQLRQGVRGTAGSKVKLELLQGDRTVTVVLPLRAGPPARLSPRMTGEQTYPVGKQLLTAGFYAIDLPSVLRFEARDGAEVVEFFDKRSQNDNLLHEIGRFNAQLIKNESSNAPDSAGGLVQLVRLNMEDPEIKPLLEHFRIKSSPSYIFVAGPSVTIKDYVDVVRHRLDSATLKEHLEELLLSRSKGDEFLPFIKPGLSAKWAKITNREVRQEGLDLK